MSVTAFKAMWSPSDFLSGDETLVPHVGLRAKGLKMFIPRKPHNTGIKLYLLADVPGWYVYDIILYNGQRPMLVPNRSCGPYKPFQVSHLHGAVYVCSRPRVTHQYFRS